MVEGRGGALADFDELRRLSKFAERKQEFELVRKRQILPQSVNFPLPAVLN